MVWTEVGRMPSIDFRTRAIVDVFLVYVAPVIVAAFAWCPRGHVHFANLRSIWYPPV